MPPHIVPVFFHRTGAHRDLHSFPTRRSSDLDILDALLQATDDEGRPLQKPNVIATALYGFVGGRPSSSRSEEHTSELQSQFHLVCRLLLEKKKNDDVAGSQYMLEHHV